MDTNTMAHYEYTYTELATKFCPSTVVDSFDLVTKNEPYYQTIQTIIEAKDCSLEDQSTRMLVFLAFLSATVLFLCLFICFIFCRRNNAYSVRRYRRPNPFHEYEMPLGC